jgi:cobalt-zinc-cadmium resistance protein CzcA
MINSIISFSIRNKLIVILMVLGLVVWGIYSIRQIPIGAVPDITNNQVQVITTSRNLSTEDIEQYITCPIELEMTNLPGVQEIRSISKFGLSVVTIVFEDDMGTWLPRQLIAEKIRTAQEKIPEGFGVPAMGPITTGLGEIFQYLLDVKPGYDTVYSTMDLRTIQDWIVKRQLSGIAGVVEVNTWGGYLKQYEVAVDPDRLRGLNITIGEVFTALEGGNENAGGGYIEKFQESYFVRGEGVVESIEDIENIAVKTVDGTPILVRDIGKVQFGHAMRFGAITANGQGEKVMGQIMMLKGANSNEVIERVKERVEEVQKSLPEGVYINPFLERSELIRRTTATVEENLFLGALIVIFVVVLLLGNLRSGLIIASIIPLSLLFAISLMNLFGISANLMSLGAIDFGIIIDGAVIIVEFVLHQFSVRKGEMLQLSGSQLRDVKDDITEDASKRMMRSAFFGQIIILIVFIPILSLSGVEGKLFKPMAMSFSFALIGAMLLCLTYVPVISSLFLRPPRKTKMNLSDRLMAFIQGLYLPSIRFALNNKALTIGGAFMIWVLSLITFTRMGGEFIPTLDEGDYVVQPILRPGTSLSETIRFCTQIENILLDEFPEVTQVASRIGAAEVPTDPMSMEMSDIIIRLKPRHQWVSASSKEELAEKMKAAMSAIPGVEYEFTQPIEMRFNELITGVRADLAIKIFGEDLDVLYEMGNRIKTLVAGVEGASDISVEQIAGLPQMVVQFDRVKMAQYGLKITDLNKYIRLAFAGETAGMVFEGERRFDLAVRFDQQHRQDIDNLRQLYVDLPDGGQIPLREVANIEIRYAPAQISRDDTHRRIVVGINVRNRDVESLVHEIQGIISQRVQLPEGYYITYGGQFQNLVDARNRLQIAVPVALLLILVLLFFTFGSVVQALLVFTAIPLSAIGGVYLLWLRDMPFSISAGIGFIALFGIATLNGIVMIGYFNVLRERGISDLKERVCQGAKSRLRPVLLTASAAAFGFFPMAISTSAGAEVQRPLATVVIGGLITATLLTLVVLPALYYTVYGSDLFKKLERYGLKTIVFFVLALVPMQSEVFAQDQRISLDAAIDTARANNASYQNAQKRVDVARQATRTAWTLGETEVGYMRGQIDGVEQDYQWTVRQNFGSPFLQSSRHKLLKEMMDKELAGLHLSARMLERDVTAAYYSLLWLMERKDLLERNYRLYDEAGRIADLKYETGESNYLSKVVMQTRKETFRIRLRDAEAGIAAAVQEFMKLLQTEQYLLPAEDSLRRIAIVRDPDSIGQFLSAPALLEVERKNVEVAKQNIRVERNTITPGLYAGYFNQSLGNVRGFQGWELGMRIPLWLRPNMAGIQSAKLQYEMVSNRLHEREYLLQKDLRILQEQLEALQAKLYSMEQTALRNAALIIENADILYRNGEIEYLEYLRNITDAIDLEVSYLDALNNYNQTAIEINYLINQK